MSDKQRKLTDLEMKFVRVYLGNGRNGTQAYLSIRPEASSPTAAKEAFRILSRPHVIAEIEAIEQQATDALMSAAGELENIESKSREISALVIPQVLRLSAERLAAMRAYIAERASKDAIEFQALRIAEMNFTSDPSVALKSLELVARMEGHIIDQRKIQVTQVRDLSDDEVNVRLRTLISALSKEGAEDVTPRTH